MIDSAGIRPTDIGFLATATTQADGLVPGLASGVHAAMGLPPLEVASLQSVCASSMMALKAATLQVKAGEHRAALAIGTEFSSRYFRPGYYLGTDTVRPDGTLPADAEFLRWTLSDGAAGVLIEDRPAERGPSLRIDWITLTSYADRFAPCMTGGHARASNGTLTPWSQHESIAAATQAGAFQLRQDVDALYRMLPVWIGEFMAADRRRADRSAGGRLVPVPLFGAFAARGDGQARHPRRMPDPGGALVHQPVRQGQCRGGVDLPADRRPAAIGQPQGRQKVLCAVPESGQCIMAFAGMTVVEGEDR